MQPHHQRGVVFFFVELLVNCFKYHRPFENLLTGHSKRPPQPAGLFLALLELHAAHSDDLTNQEESLPH